MLAHSSNKKAILNKMEGATQYKSQKESQILHESITNQRLINLNASWRKIRGLNVLSHSCTIRMSLQDCVELILFRRKTKNDNNCHDSKVLYMFFNLKPYLYTVMLT